jgi:TatD DNase family protein
MIDCHTHLEQKNYDADRDQVIKRCIDAGLKAVITCCAHPDDIDTTVAMLNKYPNYIFATASIHPEYIAEMKDDWLERILHFINDPRVVGVGETGLDFKWVETDELRRKQSALFITFINAAKDLNKPLVIHARGAFKEAIDVLELNGAKKVVMHFFSAKDQLKRVVDNDWYITINTTVCNSKKMKQIVRDTPMERILLETDAPWLDLEGGRNEPTAIKKVVEKIAEVKNTSFSECWRCCGLNAVELFKLPIRIDET